MQKYAKEKGHDVTHITFALSNASAYPRACQSVMSMLSKGQLNPGDITVLHKFYSSEDPPPISMLQQPLFLTLLVDSLFTTKIHKINPDHRHKYAFLLAYAASVTETWHKGTRKSIYLEEMNATSQAIDKAQQLVTSSKGQMELLSEIVQLYHCIR